MSYPAVVLSCLGSTSFFALSTALKHRAARQSPDAQDLQLRQLGAFVAATARSPLWLAGLLADAGGLALQVLALHLGALAVVQPLMITALLFSLLLNHRFARTRITVPELWWALVLVVALVGFLLVSGAASPQTSGPPMPADREPAVLAGVLAVLLAVVCVRLARVVPRQRGAALLGIAVGSTYACTAALIKSCTNVAADGPLALLTSWQLYLLIAVGAGGLILNQLAFQAGPLNASLPAIATVDPLLSVALGVFVYDEHLRAGVPARAGEVVTLLLLCVATFFLTQVEAQEAPAGSVPEDLLRRPG